MPSLQMSGSRGVILIVEDDESTADLIADLVEEEGFSVSRAGGGLEAIEAFARDRPEYDHGWAHFSGGEGATEAKVTFSWPLGDVVTSLARAGLRIERLEEFPSDAAWRFGPVLDAVQRLPGRYLLVARKDGD